jgi:transglutaminase-like putative cysteine protease
MRYYAIRHQTSFYYSKPISESVMELQMQPRDELHQRCARFQVVVSPKARVSILRDYYGNRLATFDVPSLHHRLMITCESIVEMSDFSPMPEALPQSAWDVLAQARHDSELFEWLVPSKHTRPTPTLAAFVEELRLPQEADPLTLLRALNARLYEAFDYQQESTTIDSPLDEVIAHRRGVCQDFTHLMIAIVRGLGIPSRYVSGYLYHGRQYADRSAADASHAWLEAWLPTLGWVGFDPTNDILCAERHVRVAIGRDYADVPPTRGVFRGEAETRLEVAVRVTTLDTLPLTEETLKSPVDWSIEAQQQQQQQ